jgi:dihydroorotate dehydrogenase (NAD+) catalytic subunit
VKAKRRVVTNADRAAPVRANRTPTVRRFKSAFVTPPGGGGSAPGGGSTGSPGGGGSAPGDPPAGLPPAGGGSTVELPGSSRFSAAPEIAGLDARAAAVDLTVDLAPGRGGLVLANPILVASGTFGYGIEYGEVVDVERLGAICCKGTTIKPRIGNPPPRVTETPGGMLNSIGLQNPGVDAVIEKYAPLWQAWRVPVIVNVAGESIADYVEVARRLDGVPGVAGIELNISCPNVGKGGLQFAIDEQAAGAVTAAVRRATDLPLLVKLSPNVADVRPIARAIAAAGADALTAINTLSGIAVARDRRRPLLGNVFGGLSGPAIKPVALRVVYEVCQVVDIPVVAIGGIHELADVLDFLAVGAVAVQVGTAIFADPGLPVRLVDELADAAARAGHASYRPFIGTALPRKPGLPSAKGVEYRP